MKEFDADKAGKLVKAQREMRNWSGAELARRAKGIAVEEGVEIGLTQQGLSLFENGNAKKRPVWLKYVEMAFKAADNETSEDPELILFTEDRSVAIQRLPGFAGAGGGGLGEGDGGYVTFSRDLVERELRRAAEDLIVIDVKGDSMEPRFFGGDQLLVDRTDKALSQPGTFCLWDGDGYVVKNLQRVAGSDPAKVRVISINELYRVEERLVEEIDLQGRVIWFGRRVQ